MKNPILSTEQLAAFRRKACAIVRELGACLEHLEDAAESQALPGNQTGNELMVHMHLQDAYDAILETGGHANDLGAMLAPLVVRAEFVCARADEVKGGAA